MTQDQEREAFEVAARTIAGLNPVQASQSYAFQDGRIVNVGDYIRSETQLAWHIWQARAALAAQPQATQAVPQDLESLAINRYRSVPDGVIAYKVVAGDGERSLFSGTKDECQIVARKLTEAFLDGAHAMLAAAPTAPAQPWKDHAND